MFVPALVVFAHLTQLEAVATSLVAIVLVAVVGTVRQREYGNVRLRDGLLIGVLSPLGVLVGVVLANALPERALELSFAGGAARVRVATGSKRGACARFPPTWRSST